MVFGLFIVFHVDRAFQGFPAFSGFFQGFSRGFKDLKGFSRVLKGVQKRLRDSGTHRLRGVLRILEGF